MVRPDPVMELGGTDAIAVEAGDPEHRARARLDQAEMEFTIPPPLAPAALGLVACLLQRWPASPRHPREKLGTRVDHGLEESLRMGRAHRLQLQALRLQDIARDGHGPAYVLVGPTQTVWMLVNSRIPYDDSSRP